MLRFSTSVNQLEQLISDETHSQPIVHTFMVTIFHSSNNTDGHFNDPYGQHNDPDDRKFEKAGHTFIFQHVPMVRLPKIMRFC